MMHKLIYEMLHAISLILHAIAREFLTICQNLYINFCILGFGPEIWPEIACSCFSAIT